MRTLVPIPSCFSCEQIIQIKMNRISAHRALHMTVLSLSLAGCAAPLPLEKKLPATPAAFKEADQRSSEAVPATAHPHGDWWKVFADPLLDDLVARSANSNTTIQQAAARLTQARALARAAGANRMPQAGLNAGVSRQGGPLINAAGADGTLINTAANLSYEIDLVGKLSKAAEAANLDVQSRDALLRSAHLLVQADIAQAYLSLRALDAERALVRETADAQRETLRLIERRQKAGLVPELDVARARAEAAATDAEGLALDRRRAELEHALAFLTGEAPSTFRIDSIEWKAALPVIPPGIPSAVLARRPDVSAAQRSMQAAQTRLGLAHTAWFPNLALTASGGFASTELGDLFKLSARAWGIGAVLALPLFDGGRRAAAIDGAGADLELALANYREQMLVAFRDVEDQLSALRLLAAQAEALVAASQAASRAAELADSRYRSGLSSQLDALDARRGELRNRRAALAVQSLRYQVTVGLVRALGGGWDGAAKVGSRGAGNGAVALDDAAVRVAAH